MRSVPGPPVVGIEFLTSFLFGTSSASVTYSTALVKMTSSRPLEPDDSVRLCICFVKSIFTPKVLELASRNSRLLFAMESELGSRFPQVEPESRCCKSLLTTIFSPDQTLLSFGAKTNQHVDKTIAFVVAVYTKASEFGDVVTPDIVNIKTRPERVTKRFTQDALKIASRSLKTEGRSLLSHAMMTATTKMATTIAYDASRKPMQGGPHTSLATDPSELWFNSRVSGQRNHFANCIPN
mmetsp:Transcript_13839/g.20987  ORF Transcript_13839/g.20987 Transcript_13839/m.20987 type:complete len:238 (-) Transcript_13839:1685-2398(-)